jgi:hypothetical protein
MEERRTPAPGILFSFDGEAGIIVDMLGPDGWERTRVANGAGWRMGNPALPYEVHVRLRPRDEGAVRAGLVHRLLHEWHRRLHHATDDPWEGGRPL